MAGDWLKVRLDLHEDPAVIAIALATGEDEDGVVGRLVRLWSWANRQTSDGYAAGVTLSWIDRFTNVSGFAQAMISSGWLKVEDIPGGNGTQRLCFPKWDKHNSQSAKQRALTSVRMARKRAQESDGDVTPPASRKRHQRREEKRREEEYPPTPMGESEESHPEESDPGPDEGFNAFWMAYPRKTAKGAARKAWDKLKPSPDLVGQMLAALEWQRASAAWTKDGGQFIPHPATWLNSQRWLDERPETVGPMRPRILTPEEMRNL